MFFLARSCFLMFLFSIIVNPLQINLDLTKWENELMNNSVIQHDCLHVPAWEKTNNIHEIISYCISELSSNWNIQINHFDQIFTFANLSRLNITSQQLYLWSAPMDTIEDYQSYLDQPSSSNQTTMSMNVYYNCTLPRFGPMCQYEFDYYKSNHSSLNEIINEFYWHSRLVNRNQTCYIHLQCNLGKTSLCIGWNNICDGTIQCIDGVDEEHCWQLEINECKNNEYRCADGQCIPLIFLKDNDYAPDCLDGSDENLANLQESKHIIGPPFRYHDIICLKRNIITGSGSLLEYCHDTYAFLFRSLIFSNTFDSRSDLCWFALMCYFKDMHEGKLKCDEICLNNTCKEQIDKNCPIMFFMPDTPIAFGHIYFAYTKDYITKQTQPTITPEYLCYNKQLCNEIDLNITPIPFNNTICYRPQDLPFNFGDHYWTDIYVPYIQRKFSHCNTILRNNSSFCNKTTMYQCINSSKCIAKIRLLDGINDCDYNDDESLISINEISLTTHIKCIQSNKFISRKLAGNRYCDCVEDIYGVCDDEYSSTTYIREHPLFATICDGIVDLKPTFIDGRNHTDETECEQWLCNNPYTRCDGIWSCLNGTDEMDCYPSSLISCPSRSYLCLSPEAGDYLCLPLNKTNDGHIDCLGAADEPQYCPITPYSTYSDRFYCAAERGAQCILSGYLCNNNVECLDGDDENLCKHYTPTSYLISQFGKCNTKDRDTFSDVEKFLCNLFKNKFNSQIVPFSFGTTRKSNNNLPNQNKNIISKQSSITFQTKLPCHRDLSLQVWLDRNTNESITTCLCSSKYYGNKCQYQNERVNLIVQFQSYSDSWQTTFTIIIKLIDNSNERTIHSYQQFTYLPVSNCQTKYTVDLLYSTRPKDSSKEYFIHIDIYNKVLLTYRGSLLISLSFPFLPVERIAVILTIPHTNDDYQSCLNRICIHGQCVRYFNDPQNTTFCHCNQGWFGQSCNLSHHCTCSSDSLCLNKLPNNRSLCLCPMNKWGSRCFLHNNICKGDDILCEHGGQCIPLDRNVIVKKQFECICTNGYFGERCQFKSNEIILSFNENIILPSSMIIHFIEIKENASPENGTTLKLIPMYHQSIIVRWPRPFHIAFVEFHSNKYYLIIIQKIHNQSIVVNKTIQSTDRCPHLREIVNETIIQLHLLRRMKYYHQPCQQQSPFLSCFYDDDEKNNSHGHFCLCDEFDNQRQANCFEFHHQTNFDCQGRSTCEHDAQCFQDSATCPSISLCICPSCYYGSRCQFSSNVFSFSLDSILGYHIQPHLPVHHQPIIIQISVTMNVIIFIVGMINGILSLITFRNKETLKTGCGFYLIGSSITTLLTIIFLTLKLSILIGVQITLLTNQSFLQFQCYSMDFLVRISLHMDQWFNACVAMERANTAIQGTYFNKRRSKQIAKLIIPILLLVTCSTLIHDPYHRQLSIDFYNEQQRIWCIVTYPPHIQTFDFVMNITHFGIPFIINLVSAIIIIRKTMRLRKTAKTNLKYKEVLREKIVEFKHLLITPILLILLAIPRVIISFISDCNNATDQSWIFLLGYFAAFGPPMLIFVIHVIPSKMYKKEFNKTIQTYRQTIRARMRR